MKGQFYHIFHFHGGNNTLAEKVKKTNIEEDVDVGAASIILFILIIVTLGVIFYPATVMNILLGVTHSFFSPIIDFFTGIATVIYSFFVAIFNSIVHGVSNAATGAYNGLKGFFGSL